MLRDYTGADTRLPYLRVLCFGRSVDYRNAPPRVARCLDPDRGYGVWIREMRAAVAILNDTMPIRNVVLHELTHGLLDLLTDGFPYPMAIQEGFARAMEYIIHDDIPSGKPNDLVDTEATRQRRHLQSAYCLTVRELLLDPHRYWRKDSCQLERMTNLSFWLNVYLFRLAKKHPRAKRILSELLSRNIRTPEGVYEWMQEVVHMRADQLEDSFCRFCTTGAFPE